MRKVCNGGSGAAVASQRNGDAAEGDSDLPLVVVKRELAKDSDGSSVARFCRMKAATTYLLTEVVFRCLLSAGTS